MKSVVVVVVAVFGCARAPRLPPEPACVEVTSPVGMCTEIYRDGGLVAHSCDSTLCDRCFKARPSGESYYDQAEACGGACR